MNKKKFFIFLGVFSICATVVAFYWNLVNTFWTQDEWWELGRAVAARGEGIKYYFTPWGGHVVPLMLFILNLQFYLFGMHIFPYAVIAMLGHATISLLLAFFAYRLTGRLLLGFLSGLIFSVNTAPFHAVTYLAGGVTHIHGATFFFLLSLIFFAKYIETGFKVRHLVGSLFCIFMAVGFMEYVAFYFFLVPICYILFCGKRSGKLILRDLVIIIFLGAAFFSYRFLSQKIHIYGSNFIGTRSVEDPSLSVANPVFGYFSDIIRNTMKLLPRILYQVWMTEDAMSKYSGYFRNYYVFSYVMSAIVVGFIITAAIIFARLKRYFLVKLTVAAALLTVFGGFPAYVFPTFPDLIESRYLYAPSLGFSFLAALFLVAISDFITSFFKSRKVGLIVYPLIICLALVPFSIKNYRHITGRIQDTVDISKMRRALIYKAISYHPKIKPKSVFYCTTNLSYPGIPWPFSLAYTMLVMYSYHGDYKGGEKFFRGNWLTTVGQGYEDHGDVGFGTFYEFVALIETLQKYNLSEENVYALRWDATPDSMNNLQVTHASPPIYQGQLKDITDEIRPIVKRILKENACVSARESLEKYVSADFLYVFDRPSRATYVNSEGVMKTADYGIPRFTDFGTGSSLGLLIEGYSVNYALFSEEFNNQKWLRSEGVVINPDAFASPDAKNTAESAVFKDKGDFIEQAVEYQIRDKDFTNYTFSLYLKSPQNLSANLFVEDSRKKRINKTVDIGPSWKRFELTFADVKGGPFKIGLNNAQGEFSLWGAQVEEYPYATSYIPTNSQINFRAGDLTRAGAKSSLPMERGTVGLWFISEWSAGSNLNHMLFYNGDYTHKDCLGLEASPIQLRFRILDANGAPKYADYYWNFNEVKDTGWNYVVATWDKGDIKLYLNGKQLKCIVSGQGTGITTPGTNLANWPNRIGVNHGWYYMHADAAISKLELLDHPLGANEVLERYSRDKNDYFRLQPQASVQ